jgi:hypothetical protein
MTTADAQPARMPRGAYRATLAALIRARGLDRFAPFATSVEGRIYPNGMDETSGLVVDERGRVFFFWTGWDQARGAPTLRMWDEVDPSKVNPAAYRRARQQVGLDD